MKAGSSEESSSTSQKRERRWSEVDSVWMDWLTEEVTERCSLVDAWKGPRMAHPKMVFQAVSVFLGPGNKTCGRMSPPNSRSILPGRWKVGSAKGRSFR